MIALHSMITYEKSLGLTPQALGKLGVAAKRNWLAAKENEPIY
jgi:hypothetical protein